MKITPIITHFNTPLHLFERCMDSVISLFGNNYIIVDDASDKLFLKNLEKYSNVIYLPENVGTYFAFEFGLNLVSSKYTMRVDSDDYLKNIPPIDDNHDAFVNNIHNKITLNYDDFLKAPYAGLNGIVVKTEVLKKVWFTGDRVYGDIVIFSRLIKNFKCKMNDKCCYVYERRKEGGITNIPFSKQRKHIAYAKSIMKEDMSLAKICQIEVTTKCNMKCFYCPIEDMPHKDMDFELYKSIIDKYYMPTKIRLQGTGEPTLCGKLLDMIKYAKSKGHYVDFITNGKNKIDKDICRNTDKIIFSVDETYINKDKETKALEISKETIVEAINLCSKVEVYSVNIKQDLSQISKFCKEHKIRHFIQKLQTKESYQKKYTTEKNETKGFSCMYVNNNRMDYYFANGTKAPCCFMVHEKNSMTREEVKKSLKNKIVPTPCTGCSQLR